MSSSNVSTASWDTLAASLDRLSMVAEPKTPEPTYFTAASHNGWDIENLTAKELYEVLRPIENWREAKDTLDNGWGMPSPDVLFHWYHAYTTALEYRKKLETEETIAAQMYKTLEETGIAKNLHDLIARNRWCPGATKEQFKMWPGVSTTPTPSENGWTPAPKRRRDLQCYRCNKVGHKKKTCSRSRRL